MLNRWRKSSSNSIVEILKELYGVHLTGRDRIKYNLIEKYWKIVPYRFIKEYYKLREKGQKQSAEMFKTFTYDNNPFLKMIPKEESGVYYPVPIVFTAEEPENTDITDYFGPIPTKLRDE